MAHGNKSKEFRNSRCNEYSPRRTSAIDAPVKKHLIFKICSAFIFDRIASA